ncbi:MAG TPA: choice-of-anchor D domain-containing protein [Actinomycetota bacterium]|nr:choice-of-anchor D domain-containing protein [Actinomycetota bacterium]
MLILPGLSPAAESVGACSPADASDDRRAPTSLSLPVLCREATAAGDVDWYKVGIKAGQRIQFASRTEPATIATAFTVAGPDQVTRTTGCTDTVTADRCDIAIDKTGDWIVGIAHEAGGSGGYVLAITGTNDQNDCGSGQDAGDGEPIDSTAAGLTNAVPVFLDADTSTKGVRKTTCAGTFDHLDSIDAFHVGVFKGSKLVVESLSGAAAPKLVDPEGVDKTPATAPWEVMTEKTGRWTIKVSAPNAAQRSPVKDQLRYSFSITATPPAECGAEELDAGDTAATGGAVAGVENRVCTGILDARPTTKDAGDALDAEDWYSLIRATSSALAVTLDSSSGQCLQLVVDSTAQGTTCDGGSGVTFSSSSVASVKAGVKVVSPPLALEATSVDFGKQRFGSRSDARTVKIRNNSASPATVALAVGGVNPDDFTVTSTCGTLVANGTCVASFIFTPGAQGVRSARASVTVTSPTGLPPRNITLLGTGEYNPLQVSAPEMAFPRTKFGVTNEREITLTNVDSNRTIDILRPSITGANAGDFSLDGTCKDGRQLRSGESCTLKGRFTPRANGARAAELIIPSNTVGDPTKVFLAGIGDVAIPSPALSTITFPSTPTNQTSVRPLVITNSGDDDMRISNLRLGGTNSADFTIAGADCTGRAVAKGATCTANVTFAPRAVGNRVAVVTVEGNFIDTASVNLAGTGTPSTQAILVEPETLDFGPQNLNTETVARDVIIRNVGGVALRVTQIRIRAGNASEFLIKSDPCSNQDVVAGGSCTAKIAFKPAQLGTRQSNVFVTSNASSEDAIIPISGVGVGDSGILGLNTSSLAFGERRAGTTTEVREVNVTNTGTSALRILGIDTTPSSEFTLRNQGQTGICSPGQQLARNSSCRVAMTFSPPSVGARTGSLRITSDAPGSPHSVALSGTGTAPLLTVNRAALDFGDQTQGVASSASEVSLSNTGNADLKIASVGIAGDEPRFFMGLDECTGRTLAPGASCAAGVVFNPKIAGAHQALLRVVHGAGTPREIALTGRGVPPASILDGVGGTYVLTITGVKVDPVPPQDCGIPVDASDTLATASNLGEVLIPDASQPQEFLCESAVLGPVPGDASDPADFFSITKVKPGNIVTAEFTSEVPAGTLLCQYTASGQVLDATRDTVGNVIACAKGHRWISLELDANGTARFGVTGPITTPYAMKITVVEQNDCGIARDAADSVDEVLNEASYPTVAFTGVVGACGSSDGKADGDLSNALDAADVYRVSTGTGKTLAGITATVVPRQTHSGTGSDYEIIIHRPDGTKTTGLPDGGAGQPETLSALCSSAPADTCGNGVWYVEVRHVRGARGKYLLVIGGTPA